MIKGKRWRFWLLESGDEIHSTDQYYNPQIDAWLPVELEFVGSEYDPDESKPVRRWNRDK